MNLELLQSYPLKQVELKKSEDGKHWIITDGETSIPCSNPHDIDHMAFAQMLHVHPRSIFVAQVGCSSYEPEQSARDDFFEDGVFQPKLLAEKIMTIETFLTSEQSKETYVWREGYYQPLGETVIQQYAKRFLEQEFRKRRLAEVIAYIKASTFTTFEEPPKNLINLENGVYNIETQELLPHDPRHHFFNKIPVKYQPDCKAPLISTYLRQITATEEDAQILEEIAAYCLYRAYPIHKALMLVGNGANSKTTFLDLLAAFLGNKFWQKVWHQVLSPNRAKFRLILTYTYMYKGGCSPGSYQYLLFG